MSVLFIFLVLIAGASAWWWRSHPVEAGRIRRRIEASGRAEQPGGGLSPKHLGDQILRAVIRSAHDMPNGSKYVLNSVLVVLPSAMHASLGDELIEIWRGQVQGIVDKEIGSRGWHAASPTSIRVTVDQQLDADEVRIECLAGSATEMAETQRPRGGGNETQLAVPVVDALECEGRVLPLGTAEAGATEVVGRCPNPGIELPTEDGRVSRRQFSIAHRDGTRVFTNLGLNGTRVNGERVESTTLHHGDVITLPDGTDLTFRSATAERVAS